MEVSDLVGLEITNGWISYRRRWVTFNARAPGGPWDEFRITCLGCRISRVSGLEQMQKIAWGFTIEEAVYRVQWGLILKTNCGTLVIEVHSDAGYPQVLIDGMTKTQGFNKVLDPRSESLGGLGSMLKDVLFIDQ